MLFLNFFILVKFLVEKNLLIDSKILITPVNDKGKIVKMPIEMLDKLQLSKI